VLTLDRAIGDFEAADVLIEGKTVSAVRPNITAPNAEIIDAARMIVMPSFVDTHRHMWQGILRNVLPDGSLDDYRDVIQRTFGAKYTPDDVYAGDLCSALGAIESGVTCILDWSHIHNSPAHTDAATSVPNDFFSQMRTVFSLQKREVWERRHAGDKNLPAFLTVREVLEFATIEGARANGLDGKIGTLTPGKEADIILLRTDRLNVMPFNNAVGAVVTNMGPQNVDTVLIAGKVIKRRGQMVGLDFARLQRLGDEARDRVYTAAKVKNSRV
jgi:cytosine/adenosine deaminase-related metal-dependent hydrolase